MLHVVLLIDSAINVLNYQPANILCCIACVGGYGDAITNTCNASQKVCRLLVEYINGTVNKQDCMQHLRNVCINGLAKDVNKYFTEFLQENIETFLAF